MRPWVRVAVVLLLAAVLLPAIVSACPLCADAKSDADYGGGAASLPHGFYYSILFMVSAPFLVIGGFILSIVHARRRARELSCATGSTTAAGSTSDTGVAAGGLVADSPGARP